MATEIEGKDPKLGKEERRDLVPPVSVPSASMQHDQRIARLGGPLDDMKPNRASLIRLRARHQEMVASRGAASAMGEGWIGSSHSEFRIVRVTTPFGKYEGGRAGRSQPKQIVEDRKR